MFYFELFITGNNIIHIETFSYKNKYDAPV